MKDDYDFNMFMNIQYLSSCFLDKEFEFSEDEFIYFHNDYKEYVAQGNMGVKAFYQTLMFLYLCYKNPSEEFIINHIVDCIDWSMFKWENHCKENNYKKLSKILRRRFK
jgi:hypothetical protein